MLEIHVYLNDFVRLTSLRFVGRLNTDHLKYSQVKLWPSSRTPTQIQRQRFFVIRELSVNFYRWIDAYRQFPPNYTQQMLPRYGILCSLYWSKSFMSHAFNGPTGNISFRLARIWSFVYFLKSVYSCRRRAEYKSMLNETMIILICINTALMPSNLQYRKKKKPCWMAMQPHVVWYDSMMPVCYCAMSAFYL